MKDYPKHKFTFRRYYQLGKDFINKHANIVNSAVDPINQIGLII